MSAVVVGAWFGASEVSNLVYGDIICVNCPVAPFFTSALVFTLYVVFAVSHVKIPVSFWLIGFPFASRR